MLKQLLTRFDLHQPQTVRIAARGLAWGLHSWARTCDYRTFHYDPGYDPKHESYQHRSVAVFWHEYASVLLPHWSGQDVTLLVSHHRDGELLSHTAHALGYSTVRGSTTRGGAAALRQLSRAGQTQPIAIATDGPQGPRRQMAPGAIYLASVLRLPILPVGVGVRSAWRLKTWDRMAISKPLTKIRIVIGPPIWIPPALDREGIEEFRVAVQDVLLTINDLADHLAHRKRHATAVGAVSARRKASLTPTGRMPNMAAASPLRTTVGLRSPSIKCRPTA